MKRILGLDIGTNSIGWSVVNYDLEGHNGIIEGAGSRIIPMDGDTLGKFEAGLTVSKAALRRQARSARRLLQRYKLRRSRLIRAFQLLGWVSADFPADFKKLEKFNINDFMPFSEETIAEAKLAYENDRITNDWIIYYLRTKALEKKITLSELARILYHFNQRRGFKSSRKDIRDSDEPDKIKYPLIEKFVAIVKVTQVVEKEEDKGIKVFDIHCSNATLSFTAEKKRETMPDWLDKEIEFEVTKKTTKAGEITFTINDPDRSDWEKMKIAHEKALVESGLTVGQYYFSHLKTDKNYRVKQRIIDRSFYQAELQQIWEVQQGFNPQLADDAGLSEIASTFYKHNNHKQKEIRQNSLKHLFFNDIIYYQRDLKSQKHLIAECPYEKKKFTDPVSGKEQGIKVVPKSAPVFQEFRIWQTIHNLRLIKKEDIIDGKTKIDIDRTDEYLDNTMKAKLFGLFDSRGEVSQDSIFNLLGFKKDRIEEGVKTYSWNLNYPDNKDFKGNETKALFRKVFKKHDFAEAGEALLSNPATIELLWHIIYSLPDGKHVKKALSNKKHFQLPEVVIDHLARLPEFPGQYAAYSAKAIKKMLSLMRCGTYWNQSDIDKQTGSRIANMLNGEYDEGINDKTRAEIARHGFTQPGHFQGLPVFLANYVVYGRHSERESDEKFTKPEDIRVMELLANNSLRNPIVEKVARETLQMVKAVWQQYGQPDEIHIELGRDLKKNNKEREDASKVNNQNRVEKERIAALLRELKTGNPQSPIDIDKFQVWKQNSGNEGNSAFEDLFKVNRAEFISNADIEKYRLWAEQKCRSPYTGQPIPLSRLFSEAYQVEHIIPRSRFFDDSAGNKTLCEAEVNRLKDNRLGMQFIEEMGGQRVALSGGGEVRIFTMEEYNDHIDIHFFRKKKRYFKLSEVPEEFVSRQLNDTRYISRTIAALLYPVVKDPNGIVYTNGAITSELKTRWGLHKKWKELLKPRFERLEEILNRNVTDERERVKLIEFDDKTKDYHFAKEYKRIDHRHHALDAVIIACTSRAHIKYLNTLNAFNDDKKEWEKYNYLLNAKKRLEGKDAGMREFEKPWPGFTVDVFNALQEVIVSHKNSNKLVSITVNRYKKYTETSPGKFELTWQKQQKPSDTDKSWVAVRKSMFAQPMGQVRLAEYKKNQKLADVLKYQLKFIQQHNYEWNSPYYRIALSDLRKQADRILWQCNFDIKSALAWLKEHPLLDSAGSPVEVLDLLKFELYAAKRVAIDASFTIDKIGKMPYAHHEKNWLPVLLKSHLEQNNNDPKLAFTGEGLEALYKKAPYPINKVTRTEGGEKIQIGNKFFEGDKGTNMFFVIRENTETGERSFNTPGLMDCIERLAAGLPVADEEPGYRNIILSPGDLVYVPDCDSEGKVIENVNGIDWVKEKKKIAERIYKMVSFTGSVCYFLHHSVAKVIVDKTEFETLNKSERIQDGNLFIKKVCVKIVVDKLGNVKL